MKKILIVAYFFATSTQAYPYFFLPDEPTIKARMHCQLVHYTLNDPRPITSFLLNYMVNAEPSRQVLIDEVQLGILWDRAGTAPDMGFIIGNRWNSIGGADRKAFNKAFVLFLDKRYHVYNNLSYFTHCNMNIESYKTSGKTRQAILLTEIQNTKMEPIALRYTLEKQEGYLWRIVEMELDGIPLKETFQNKFNQILSTSGMDGVVKYLKEETPEL